MAAFHPVGDEPIKKYSFNYPLFLFQSFNYMKRDHLSTIMEETRRQYLLDRYKLGKCSQEEKRELWQIIRSSENDEWLIREIEEALSKVDAHTDALPDIISATDARTVLHNILRQDAGKPATDRSRMRLLYSRGMAAAAILLVLLMAAYFLFRDNMKQSPTGIPEHITADIAPGTSKAILTLADGSTVMLDSSDNRVIQQNGTSIRQQGGALQYDASDGAGTMSYNTLATPKGGQFHILLPDGTKVWLNTASSLRYPTVFKGTERRVEVTGEAYFEVVKNAEMPFKVKVGSQAELTVLGTSFNVNAYSDEAAIMTTLVEGSVRVSKDRANAVLLPGQQAQLNQAGRINVIKDANVNKVLAWRLGVFNFENSSLQEVMRQLARWYDIEVVYTGQIPQMEFMGEISMGLSLKGVLKGLEKTGVHFRIEEGRKLIVMP